MRVLQSNMLQRHRTMALHSAWLLGERLASSLMSFGVFFVLARVYGPADFGVWNYALSVMQVAAGFLAASAEPILIRELVCHPTRQGAILGSGALVIGMTSSLVMVLPLAYLAATHAFHSTTVSIGMLVALSYAPNFLLVVEHFFRARNLTGAVVRARLLVGLVGSATRIGLAWSGQPIGVVALALPLETFLMGTLLLRTSRNDGFIMPRWVVNLYWVRKIAMSCWPAMVASTVVTVFFRISHVLLERLSSMEQLGLYAFGFSLLQMALSLPNILVNSLYPQMVELYQADMEHLLRRLRWLFFAASLFGWFCAASMGLLAHSVIPLAFGAKYQGAIGCAVVIFLAMPVLASGSVRAAVINIRGQQQLHLYSTILGLLILLPALLMLVPTHGAIGAAWAVVVSNLISAVATSWLFKGTRDLARCQLEALLLLTPFTSGRSLPQHLQAEGALPMHRSSK